MQKSGCLWALNLTDVQHEVGLRKSEYVSIDRHLVTDLSFCV